LILVPCVAIAYTVIPDSVKHDVVAQLRAMRIPYPMGNVIFRSGALITAQQARQQASFAIVLPAGLPDDASLKRVTTTAPDVFQFVYETTRGPVFFEVHKASPNTYLAPFFAADSASPEAKVHLEKLAAHVWHVGDQDFIVATNALTGSQLAKIKAAMGAVDAPTPPPARN
jgi:hypothetical protein